MEASGPSPGWYEDPDGRPGERYWNGSRWTEHFQRRPESTGSAQLEAPSDVPDPANDYLVIWGWITAVIFPFAGAVIGLVLRKRGDVRGPRIMALADGMLIVLVLLLVLLFYKG